MAAMGRADNPVPAKDEVTLTLTAKPPLPAESTVLTASKPGWVFLATDPLASTPTRVDPRTGAFQPSSFALATPGTLSIDRVNSESRSSERQKGLYRVEDEPGPGYRKLIEWYENMKRPLPKTAP